MLKSYPHSPSPAIKFHFTDSKCNLYAVLCLCNVVLKSSMQFQQSSFILRTHFATFMLYYVYLILCNAVLKIYLQFQQSNFILPTFIQYYVYLSICIVVLKTMCKSSNQITDSNCNLYAVLCLPESLHCRAQGYPQSQ
jgi:hypothetical protein